MWDFIEQAVDITHTTFLLFFVLGWIPRFTRGLHRVAVASTAAFWFVIGPIMYDTVGFCPVSQLQQWLRDRNGPCELGTEPTYTQYLLEKAGLPAPFEVVNMTTFAIFLSVCIITVWLWEKGKKEAKPASV